MNVVESAWPIPREHPILIPGTVHIWCLSLDLPPSQIDSLQSDLSADELDRAARYKFDRHRRRFVACRGQVRRILATYLGVSADGLSFDYGPKGKPALAAPRRESRIEYNVSHSHEMALCAVALDQELGVDIELLRAPFNFEGIANQFFAVEEVRVLRGLPDESRLQGFFTCWTRKEAVLKAVGAGLSIPLNKVVVSVTPQEPASVLKFESESGDREEWWIEHLEPSPGYVGAIASLGRPLRSICWQFNPAAE
jgi:4'-phosphopantetheinyl transferase